jgi:hypothetical protein
VLRDFFNPSLYVKLLGRAGGQTVYGGTGSADALTLYSTTHATKGDINLADVMHIHENDMQVVIGTNSPYKTSKFFVQHTYTGTTDSYGTFQGLTWTPSNTTSALIGAMGFTVQLNGSNNVTGQIKGIEGFVLHAGTGDTRVCSRCFIPCAEKRCWSNYSILWSVCGDTEQ